MIDPRVRALLPYAVLTALHLLCLATEARTAADVLQVTLMPALGYALVRLYPRTGDARLLRLTTWALVFSWLGDTIPRFLSGDPAFGAMIGSFLVAQCCYIAAFKPRISTSIVHRRRPLLTPYAVAFVVLLGLCVPAAGVLAPAVVVYGCSLAAMGILATGLNRLTWIGGAIFMASDALIALDAFDVWTQPGHDLWVMSTYCLAQLFLVLGIVGIGSGYDAEQHREHSDRDGRRARLAG
ncbi:lysoplasmalogenase [Nocardioides sp.]|uniref:lysoplasmalogenase n=1 Tax=Nocardioides sp. TaxID=35761 RepID=UPI00261E4154|nr:lysoplasmalogenase [Nocardioides sp.]